MSAEMDIAVRRLRHAESKLHGLRVALSAATQQRQRLQAFEAQTQADIDRLRSEVGHLEQAVLRQARG